MPEQTTSLSKTPTCVSRTLMIVGLGLTSSYAIAAQTINITTNQVINTPTQYDHVTLNMNGGFIIAPGGTLDIKNSTINVNASLSNPFFTQVNAGTLTLKDNTVNVTSSLTPNPTTQSVGSLIRIDHGTVNIDHNYFSVNTPYTFGFLTTNKLYATSGIKITQNLIKNFHGGIYLLNSYAAKIENNSFNSVSLSNVLNNGDSSRFRGNTFILPGNLAEGSAFEIINSANLDICDNVIASSSTYGVHIVGAKNVLLNNNKITDGAKFAISIETPTAPIISQFKTVYKTADGKQNEHMYSNRNISVTNNYIGQNRYGLSAENIKGFTVTGNTFLQKFSDAAAREYWTNNDHLLTGISNLKWSGNAYKEAFTQEVPGDNSMAKQFVVFPESGGVSL